MPATVEKICRNKRAFANELFVYGSDFPYKPKLIEIRKPQTLVLSKIEGIPYLDVPELTDEMVIKLAKAISKLHSIARVDDIVLCHWDNQPRNILWSENKQKIFLLDFEDIRFAPPEADIAHLFLFWAEMMNASGFKQMTGLFLNNYKSLVSLSQARWKDELKKAKSRFDRRRKLYNKQERAMNPLKLESRNNLKHMVVH